jgi:uncharacterized phage protein (TIGR02218 family)
MREIPVDFAARLAAETVTLCACWRFVRQDGAVFGATDHDASIILDDVDHAPVRGLGGGELSLSDGLAPGQAFASGVLEASFITEEDLLAGLWDGARVDVWRVDWRAPEHRVAVWSGRLSEVTREGDAFRAELVSVKSMLERTIGRVFQRSCDAELGDGRCGVDLSAPAFRASGMVTERIRPGRVRASGLAGHAPGWFTGGVLTWTSGALSTLKARVTLHAGDELELRGPCGAAGDAFLVTAGCDKTVAMCSERFGNTIRFRGHPHMPGPDFILSGPSAGASGGRRR